MNITVNDLLKLNYFRNLKLIAGKKGLDKTVIDCGILDYEFDHSLKGKYLYSNFHEHQFALSSFLYAKNNPYLISEAVKYLVGKGACGLVIKNVFNLKIHDSVIRYANSKDFPIFIIENNEMYFEQIIINVNDYITLRSKAEYCEHETNALLYQSFSPTTIKEYAKRLNPSFLSQFMVFYFKQKTPMTTKDYYNCNTYYTNNELCDFKNLFYRYENGIIFILSSDVLAEQYDQQSVNNIISKIVEKNDNFQIGLSNTHHNLNEFNLGLKESIYAANLHKELDKTFKKFDDLGIYKIILPLIENPELEDYSRSVLDPLIDHDAEHNTILFNTVHELVECDGNLHRLADKLKQHENTLRYRLEKISNIIGLNYRNPSHYEQLSLSIKIYIASQI